MSKEPNILQVLADNPALMAEVKKVVKAQFEFEVGNMPVGVPYEQLGMTVSTRMEGLKLVEKAFKEIESYKSTPKMVDKQNPAY